MADIVDLTFSQAAIMSDELRRMHINGDTAGIEAHKAKEDADIQKLTEHLATAETTGNKIWFDAEKDGHELSIAVVEGVGYAFTRAKKEPVPGTDDKVKVKAEVALVSATTMTGSWTSVVCEKLFNPKTITWTIAGLIATWVSRMASSLIKKAAENAVIALANSLLNNRFITVNTPMRIIMPLARTQVWLINNITVITGVGHFFSSLIIGGIFAWATQFVLELVWNYVRAPYTLVVEVYNFDPAHSWKLDGTYGWNELRDDKSVVTDTIIPPVEGLSKIQQIFGSDIKFKDAVVVHRALYHWTNESKFAGFITAAAMRRLPLQGESDNNTGFNWAYRIEKARNNSMSLHSGLRPAADYYKDHNSEGQLQHVKDLAIGTPLPISMHCPEIYNAKNDIYNLTVNIGKPLENYRAVGVQ